MSRMGRLPGFPGIILLLVCFFLSGPVLAEPPPVKIGVLAKRGAEQCRLKWAPTARYLDSRIPSHRFQIVPLSFDQIETAVARQEVDFILANSSFYVQLEVRHGARRIATLENLHADGTSHREFAGVLFTRRDRADIHSIGDLKGRTFMAVDEKSLGGWHMQWRKLKAAGFDPYRDFRSLEFGGTHDAVVHAVLRGEVDAGGVRSDTIERMALEGKIDAADLRTIDPDENCGGSLHFAHSTRHYPEWPLARAAHTPHALAKQVATALLQLPADHPAAKAAHIAGWSTPENYQVVRECLMELNLPPYEDFGHVTLLEAMRKVWPWLLGMFILTVLILVAVFRAYRLKTRLTRTQELAEERSRAWGFMQRVLDTLPVGVILVETETRTITMANPSAAAMIGLKREQIIGQPCRNYLCPGSAQQCPILDQHHRKDHAEHWLRTRKEGEIPVLKTAVTVEIHGRSYLLESFLDIRDRKQAEAERERLAKAIDQAGEMIVTTDRQGHIQYVNPAFERITGYTRDEVIGRNPAILNSGRHDKAFFREMWDTINRGETWTGRFENRRKDGTLFTDDSTITAVRDDDGEIVSFVSVKRDITAQLELENQYRQAQKMDTIGRLAGGLAHDYNNMMSVILGYAEMLLERDDLDDTTRGDVREIQHAAERSARLTAQLLGFARKQTIAPRVLNLNTVLEDLRKMLARLIGEAVLLDFQPDPDAWPVHMDPTQVDQILVNLCVNARDAMPEGGRILVRTRNTHYPRNHSCLPPDQEEGDYLTLSVTDEGCGMSRDVLDMAFEPFFTTKAKGEGTGLGLATVYGIVKQNQGFIHIDSAVGRGTTMFVNLPRHVAAETADSGREMKKRPSGGSETILLVEDEESLLRATTSILRMHGYSVLPAASAREALDLLNTVGDEIKLVISDVVMPGMNGVELIRQIAVSHPDLRCLLVSGYTSDVISDQGQLEDGVNFLQKPYNMAALTRKVREILDA